MKIILSALLDQEQQTSFSQTECRFVNTAVLMEKKKNQLRMIEKSGIHIKCTFPAFLNKLDLTIGTNIAALEWTENGFSSSPQLSASFSHTKDDCIPYGPSIVLF